MGTVPVVVVQPLVQHGIALVRGGVLAGVSPLAQAGLDESLGFAIGPRRVGLGSDVLDAKGFEQFGKGCGAIAGSVVGQDPPEGNSQAGVALQSAQQHLAGGFAHFVWVDAAEGDPGVIVNGHVDVAPATASGVSPTFGIGSVPWPLEVAQLLDVQVQQPSGLIVFVSDDLLGRIKPTQPNEAVRAHQP